MEYYEKHSDKQAAFIFLDAEKAFYNVFWNFLKAQLEYMEFGHKLLNAIDQIYTTQDTKIKVNGETTEAILIQKGTRQGCPLSPLLFILTLETLLHQIRESTEISGINIKGQKYKLQAFADDLLIILEDPENSMKPLLNVLENYSEVSGLKINKNKTKFIVKNMTKTQADIIQSTSSFLVVNKIRYLGIQLTSRCSFLMPDNYFKTIDSIKKDLNLWGKTQLSFMG